MMNEADKILHTALRGALMPQTKTGMLIDIDISEVEGSVETGWSTESALLGSCRPYDYYLTWNNVRICKISKKQKDEMQTLIIAFHNSVSKSR